MTLMYEDLVIYVTTNGIYKVAVIRMTINVVDKAL